MLKIATWNVNSVKAREERLLAFLGRQAPDLVCLQELKCIDDRFPWESIRRAGYEAAVHGQKGYNGVAILSRQRLEDVTRGFGDGAEDPAARFISGRIGSITIASAYVPNGQAVGTEKYAYKLEWLKRMRAALDRTHLPNDPLIIGGDFNVAPEARDVHDPDAWRGRILFSEPERRGLAELQAFGLQDVFRRHHAEGGHYSWWDYRMLGFPKNLGLRIDLILATSPLAGRCTSALIERDERKGKSPSDHAPVLATFSL